MERKIAPGMILVAAVLGLLGVASILSNLGAIVLGLDRVPAWMEAFGIVYGAAALLTALLIWSQSPWARLAFVVWSVLVLCAGGILWPHVESKWQLISGIVALLLGLAAAYRYVDGELRAGDA